MGLFDNYRQSNSNYVSQFVGSIAPEVAHFTKTMKGRYDEAEEQDDVLYEALGNMNHLQDEADITYANELKTEFATRMADRAKKGDYENMGRRTKRDARSFVTDYKPLANRLQAFQTIQQRVMDDDKIINPDTKNAIMGYIGHMNKGKRNPDGSLVRNADGKVALSGIQDWAYAKDVDIDAKLIATLKEVETEVRQSGFTPDGQGLLVSATGEVRTKQDLAVMAQARMRTDPEINAMIKRDAILQTYRIKGADAVAQSKSLSVSKYAELKRSGLTDQEITRVAKKQGMTLAETKVDPFEAIAQSYIERGGTREQAAEDFIRVRAEENLRAPHADLVSSILKVDKQKLDARADPIFAAKLKAMYDKQLVDYQNDLEKAEITSQYIDETGEKTTSYLDLHNANQAATTAYTEGKETAKAQLGLLLGESLNTSGGNAKADIRAWNNKMEAALNSKERQTELLNATTDANTKNELQALFGRYNTMKSQVTTAAQSLAAIPKTVYNEAVEAGWKELQASRSGTKVGDRLNRAINKEAPDVARIKTKEEFAKYMENSFKGQSITTKVLGGYGKEGSAFYSKYGSFASAYLGALDEGVKRERGRVSSTFDVYDAYGSGYTSDMTKLATNLAASAPASFVNKKGQSLQALLKEATGSLTPAEMNRYYNNMRVRIGTQLSGTGQSQVLISLPDGSSQVFETGSIGNTKPAELNARLLKSSAHNYTQPEQTRLLAKSASQAGESQLTYTDPIQLGAAPRNEVIDLNDRFAFKIITSGKDSPNGSKTAGKLLARDVNGKYMEIPEASAPLTLEQLINFLGVNYIKDTLVPER